MSLILDQHGAPDQRTPQRGPDGADLIKDANTETFMADVVEASQETPVIVDFWAPWCGPCKQLGPALEKAVKNAGGLVKMVKVNVDENQEIAAQMRVQSIPAVYAFHQGRPVDAFQGAVPESQIKSFIDKLTKGAKSPLDQTLEAADEAMAGGDAETALAAYEEIRAQDPAHLKAAAGALRALTALGEITEAEQLLASLPADTRMKADVAAAASALELARETGGGTGDAAELRARLDANPADHQTRFDLAAAHIAANDHEAAIDQLLELIRRDRAWDDEAGRKQLLKVFDTLGNAHELTVSGRRHLSSVLFS